MQAALCPAAAAAAADAADASAAVAACQLGRALAHCYWCILASDLHILYLLLVRFAGRPFDAGALAAAKVRALLMVVVVEVMVLTTVMVMIVEALVGEGSGCLDGGRARAWLGGSIAV